MPPVTIEEIFSAALIISSVFFISKPQRTSASGMFGVITVPKGRRLLIRASQASSLKSLLPLVATITGSTTMFSALYSLSLAAIVSIMPALDTIPILTASGLMSVNTQSI